MKPAWKIGSMNGITVLIPDVESHQLLCVIVNCLARVDGLKIIVMSNLKHSRMNVSRYVAKSIFYPGGKSESDWVENAIAVIQHNEIDVIMPTHEFGIRTISKYYDKFSQLCRVAPVPTVDSFDIANNKWLLSEYLRQDDFPWIPGQLVLTGEENQIDLRHLLFPVVLKPNTNTAAGRNIKLFHCQQALEAFLKHNPPKVDYLIQQYVNGIDVSFNALCMHGNILAATTQKGFMSADNPFAPQLGRAFMHDEILQKFMSKLFKQLNWSGVANVDLKYCDQTNEYYVLEINPRYWTSIEGSCLMGVNFPELVIKTALAEKFDTPAYRREEFLTLGGIVKSFKKIETIKSPRFYFKNTPLLFAIKDPLVLVLKILGNINRKLGISKLWC